MILKAAIMLPVICSKQVVKKLFTWQPLLRFLLIIKEWKALNKPYPIIDIKKTTNDIISCTSNTEGNYKIIRDLLKKKTRPDGLIASVEKLTTPIYLACEDLKLSIPEKIKVISFTNLQAALILTPTLTTVTQPAFEMGKAAAAVLFKSLEKTNFDLLKESLVIPSVLEVRRSTR